MKREKEIPKELIAWLDEKKKDEEEKALKRLNVFCTIPVRAVKMKMLNDYDIEEFRTAVIPSVDVYTTEHSILENGYLKRDSLSYFISGTRKTFPYGHIFINSGSLCLGTIFVPSKVPEISSTMPLETLFLHNDRNLSHGNSYLKIDSAKAKAVGVVVDDEKLELSRLGQEVIKYSGRNIIEKDQIWAFSADVAKQKPLPEALNIMAEIYDIIFKEDPDENGKRK